MPTYKTIAKSPTGETLALRRESDSQAAVLSALRAEGLTPVSVEVESGAAGLDWTALFPQSGKKRIRRKDLRAFMKNMTVLLRSGMDIERCLRSLEKESREPLRSILGDVARRVQHGESLSEAMARAETFNPLHVRIVRAGEYGGDLHRAFQRISTMVERESQLRGKIRNALAYPLFLLAFGILSFFVMILFVLPKFLSIYSEMNAQIPFLTRVLLGFSSFVRSQAIWGVPLVVFLVVLGWKQLPRFRENPRLDRLRMKIPGLGRLVREVNVTGVLQTLGVLLQSGLPVSDALHALHSVATSPLFGEAALEMERGVQRGGRLSTEMRKSGLFSETIVNLVSVGEESGRLEDLLLETADDMERELDDIVKTFVSLLEPVLILCVGSIIGLMVMATLLPIFKLSAGLKR